MLGSHQPQSGSINHPPRRGEGVRRPDQGNPVDGTRAEHAHGAFFCEVMPIGDLYERKVFLNRGRAWVVRELRALVPRMTEGRQDLAGRRRRRAQLSAHLRITGRIDDVLTVSGHRIGTMASNPRWLPRPIWWSDGEGEPGGRCTGQAHVHVPGAGPWLYSESTSKVQFRAVCRSLTRRSQQPLSLQLPKR
jgi:hypothetical protein